VGYLSEENRGVAARANNPTNTRILLIMAIFGLVAGIASAVVISFRFGIGLLFGTVIAFVNYFWLRRALVRAFDFKGGNERSRFAGSGYFIRYLVIGGIFAMVYALDLVPISAVLLGSAAFAFALVADGTIRLVTAVSSGPKR